MTTPPTVDDPPASRRHTLVRNVGSLVESVFLRPGRDRDTDDVFDPENFQMVRTAWWPDRLLPGRVMPYIGTAFAICTVVWLAAMVLRIVDLGWVEFSFWGFVGDRQWQLQPLLLFVHLVCLRLFKGIYSRNFDRAFRYLDVSAAELEGYKRWFMGARANLFAALIAMPFIFWDFRFFLIGESFYSTLYAANPMYLALVDPDSRTTEAWLLLGVWTFEWLMFGFYCYLMISGAVVVRRILKRHDFVDSVDLVLTERQFRPMFNVIAQAGSLVFFYGLIHFAYVVYAKSTDSDIAGLAVLVVLLAAGFGVTWSAVRGELRGNVTAALAGLEASYREARARLATMVDQPGIEDDLHRIQVQLKMSLALQQMDYLQTKYEHLGRREFLGLMFRMLAPVGTVVARVIRWGSLIAALGFGGAAIFGGDDAPKPPTEATREP